MFKEWLDDFYDILFNYRKALARIAQNRNIWHGVAIYLFVNLIVSLATSNIISRPGQGTFFIPPEISPFLPQEILANVFRFIPLVTILVQLVFGPLYFFLIVGVVNLVAELFGGRGGVIRLGAVMGYGQYPYLIVALGSLFSRYTAFNIIGLLAFAALVWSIFLKIAGLKIVYNFPWGRAVLVYFMPLIALVAALLLFLLLAIVFLLPLIMQVMESF
ncbi:MAG: YIP1 family protein [Dethiobacter sp.]|jgi:hypothetical protein|nr:MAG: YIP1 family protein [Dethiobacter sp.]